MPRLTKVRSVDMNPCLLPSRFCRSVAGWNRGKAFAKQSVAVTELYTDELRSGPPLLAETHWVRFIPKEGRAEAKWGGVPMSGSLGLGEVHEIPFDPDVLCLPDEERRRATLEVVHGCMMRLAQSLGWDQDPLRRVREACMVRGITFEIDGSSKWNPSRSLRATWRFRVDGEGDGWATIRLRDRQGEVVLDSPPLETPCQSDIARQAGTTLRWHGSDEVGLTSWRLAGPDVNWAWHEWILSTTTGRWKDPPPDPVPPKKGKEQ